MDPMWSPRLLLDDGYAGLRNAASLNDSQLAMVSLSCIRCFGRDYVGLIAGYGQRHSTVSWGDRGHRCIPGGQSMHGEVRLG